MWLFIETWLACERRWGGMRLRHSWRHALTTRSGLLVPTLCPLSLPRQGKGQARTEVHVHKFEQRQKSYLLGYRYSPSKGRR